MTVDAIKMSSTTQGTGNFVLAPIVGYRQFTDEFSLNDGTDIFYRAEGRIGQTYDGQYEIGRGRITSAGQLQRIEIYHSSSGDGIAHNFTSSFLIVSYCDSENAIASITNGRIGAAGAYENAVHGIPSCHMLPTGLLTAINYLGQDVNLLFFECPRDITLTSAAMELTTAGAVVGSTLRAGIYNCKRDLSTSAIGGFRPTTLLADFGPLPANSTGNKTWTINVPLQRGKAYAVAWMSSHAEYLQFRVATYSELASRMLQSSFGSTVKFRRLDAWAVDLQSSAHVDKSTFPADLSNDNLYTNQGGSQLPQIMCPVGLGWE